MKTIIHVSQPNIKANAQRVEPLPVITVKDPKRNRYGFEAIIRGPGGEEVARFVYRPDKPLSCGAKVWFETDLRVDVICRGELVKESNVKEEYAYA